MDGTLLGFAAAALALFLGGFVLLVGDRSASNRALGILLLVEAVFQAAFTLSDVVDGETQPGTAANALGSELVLVGFMATLGLCLTYPWLLRTLDTPYTRWLRRRSLLVAMTVFWSLLGVPLAVALALMLAGVPVGEDSPLLYPVGLVFLGVVVLSVVALLASVHAFRHSPPGPARERARAFMLAFGARDALFVAGIVLNFTSDLFPEAQQPLVIGLGGALNSLGTLVYVPLLAYGILTTQLFDIDLKVKLGIKRSTVVTIALVVILGTAKTAEFYLNKTYGLLAGGIAAGAMLVLTPRLNKIGDKVANTAMPQVQPTNAYVAFKKLEVYRAAVESANEVGMDDKQRAVLERLRGKLGLSPADTDAVEAELRSQPVVA
ncbi:MAG TPA: hypothetical protein VM327_08715 [Candidatus Thermoplasmatota archaeon]|nr:hypothetical protein [Candidatus Thermoplasmatota archaeon]